MKLTTVTQLAKQLGKTRRQILYAIIVGKIAAHFEASIQQYVFSPGQVKAAARFFAKE